MLTLKYFASVHRPKFTTLHCQFVKKSSRHMWQVDYSVVWLGLKLGLVLDKYVCTTSVVTATFLRFADDLMMSFQYSATLLQCSIPPTWRRKLVLTEWRHCYPILRRNNRLYRQYASWIYNATWMACDTSVAARAAVAVINSKTCNRRCGYFNGTRKTRYTSSNRTDV